MFKPKAKHYSEERASEPSQRWYRFFLDLMSNPAKAGRRLEICISNKFQFTWSISYSIIYVKATYKKRWEIGQRTR